MRASLAFGRV